MQKAQINLEQRLTVNHCLKTAYRHKTGNARCSGMGIDLKHLAQPAGGGTERQRAALFGRVFAGDGVECGLDLKRREIWVTLDKAGDDAGDVRTGKAVAGQVAVAAAEPGGADVDARSRKLDHFAVMKAEFERIGLFALDDRDQRRREDRRKARLRQVVGPARPELMERD